MDEPILNNITVHFQEVSAPVTVDFQASELPVVVEFSSQAEAITIEFADELAATAALRQGVADDRAAIESLNIPERHDDIIEKHDTVSDHALTVSQHRLDVENLVDENQQKYIQLDQWFKSHNADVEAFERLRSDIVTSQVQYRATVDSVNLDIATAVGAKDSALTSLQDVTVRHGDIIQKHSEIEADRLAVAVSTQDVIDRQADIVLRQDDITAKHSDVESARSEVSENLEDIKDSIVGEGNTQVQRVKDQGATEVARVLDAVSGDVAEIDDKVLLAQQAATAASESETSAEESATAAAGSATAAASSKTAAGLSATEAESSKTAAASSAGEATSALDDIKLRQTSIEASQTDVEAKQADVIARQTQVDTAAADHISSFITEADTQIARVTAEGDTQVSRVTSEGQTQIDAATTQADNAAASATAASNSESAASDSATAAASSASAAQADKEAAALSKTAAAGSATAAADSAALAEQHKDSIDPDRFYFKSEVDQKIDAKDSLPDQTDNAGKALFTNGTSSRWDEVPDPDLSNLVTMPPADGQAYVFQDGQWVVMPAVKAGYTVGEICYFALSEPPPGFFALDGSTVPNGETDFADMWAIASTSSSNFFVRRSGTNLVLLNMDDFIRGKGSSGKAIGAYESDAFRSHYHHDSGGYNYYPASQNAPYGSDSSSTLHFNHADGWLNRRCRTSTVGSSETRPKNYTALACIYHGVI